MNYSLKLFKYSFFSFFTLLEDVKISNEKCTQRMVWSTLVILAKKYTEFYVLFNDKQSSIFQFAQTIKIYASLRAKNYQS